MTHSFTQDNNQEAAETRIRSAAAGDICSASQIHNAEFGLSVTAPRSIECHPLYPSYCMIARLLGGSIDDYVSTTTQWLKEAELEFWRDSQMFIYYGKLACEMEAILFGRELTLSDLRRGAERRMGLPPGSLSPRQPLPFEVEDRIAIAVRDRFTFIAETIEHVPDPVADTRFVPYQPKGAKPKKKVVKRVAEDQLELVMNG